MTITKAYVSSRYGQLHYRIAGPDGNGTKHPPLLCLHQTPSSSKGWLPIMPALAKSRFVVAPDNPGYGMSDAPPEPVQIEDFADVAGDLMAKLAQSGQIPNGQFDVIGYHTGSIVACELSVSRPDMIRKVVLFGLAAFSEKVRTEALAQLRDTFPLPNKSLRHVEQQWALMQTLIDHRVSAEDMHISLAETLRLGSRLPWGFISVYRYDFLDTIPRVAQPVLVMNPQDDLYEVTRENSHLFPDGRRIDLPGVSHGVLSIEHDRVVREIESFLY